MLVSTSVPTPEELSEARAVDYMLHTAMRCVVSVALLGLVFISYCLEFVPRPVVAVLGVVWFLDLAWAIEGVWVQWTMHHKRLAQMERAYRLVRSERR